MEGKDREIEILIRARYPVIYIVSCEEARVEETLDVISRGRNKGLFLWTVTEGLTNPKTGGKFGENLKSPMEVLDFITKSKENALFVLKDFHEFIERTEIKRKLKDVARAIKTSYNTLMILSPILKIPQELEKDITVIDYPLPKYKEIEKILDRLVDSVKNNPRVKVDMPQTVKEKLLKASLGLTLGEAENAFAKSLVMNNHLGEEDIQVILNEKEQIIRKTGMLEYYHAQEGFEHVGGLEILKNWLVKRGNAFTEKARQYGLPEPKGLLMLGVQGCGKSLCAKVISSIWHLPLLRLDVGRIFGGFIGSSESNMRQAIQIAESLSPCILWIDEIEKGLSGMESSGATDAGTTARIFSTLLTWMQEKTEPVFVIATSNDISKLPPELLRKGRFDEIFFVDLPSQRERKEIFHIHIKKRNRKIEDFDIERLVSLAEGFSGAEIEQAIISAMYDAFAFEREISTADIEKALQETFPLSKTMSEKIQYLRKWAEHRARKASPGEGEAIPSVDISGIKTEDMWAIKTQDTAKTQELPIEYPEFHVEEKRVLKLNIKKFR